MKQANCGAISNKFNPLSLLLNSVWCIAIKENKVMGGVYRLQGHTVVFARIIILPVMPFIYLWWPLWTGLCNGEDNNLAFSVDTYWPVVFRALHSALRHNILWLLFQLICLVPEVLLCTPIEYRGTIGQVWASVWPVGKVVGCRLDKPVPPLPWRHMLHPEWD